MIGFSLKCVMVGHEDRVHRQASRVYLECAECGRETPGWQLEIPAAEPRATGAGSSVTGEAFEGAPAFP
jgi:hypothetical protein